MNGLILVIGAAGIIYCGFILYFYFGLRTLQPVELLTDNQLPEIGVIVAARNEEKSIEQTVRSLAGQNYPDHLYTIVVVNDRSEDATGEILERLTGEIQNLSVVTITERREGISPKKFALLEGVATLDTRFVAATDADCTHPKNWLRTYASVVDDNLGVATAITVNNKEKYASWFEELWQKMQYIEHNALAFVSAGSISRGRGFTANGNNMLFNKELYENAGHEAMKTHLTSGDDFFLIQSAERRNYRLEFLINKSVIAHTDPQPTIPELLNQRARWASKAGAGAPTALFFSIMTFIFYLGTFLYPVSVVWGGFNWTVFLIFLALKVFPDTLYTYAGHKKMDIPFYPWHYILMLGVHIPFVLYVTFKGMLGSFTWKGTKYRR